MKSLIKIKLLWILLLLPALALAKDYDEGIEYTQLKTAVSTQTGDKIEVLEFFWYGCPHCFAFEPALKKWKKTLPANVQFIRVPSPLNPSWMVHTKAYYTLQIMGEGDKHHDAIFNAMHIQKKKIYSKEAIADFLASRGVNKEKFLSNFDSFAVEMRARQALQLGQQYKVNGVPMLTVNGKYTISGSQAGSHQGMVDIANFLIQKESK
ncbi:Periplasmic thiol:disulfide interchange protein DsbA [hydrothermal vent metagenome]|uniref:Thiol:disulfide interchange protein DsbA n=1 Tax=hydrothermal vent metagenome TaxID=652676 RepID=A0A3B0Y0A1_9ZZZZ